MVELVTQEEINHNKTGLLDFFKNEIKNFDEITRKHSEYVGRIAFLIFNKLPINLQQQTVKEIVEFLNSNKYQVETTIEELFNKIGTLHDLGKTDKEISKLIQSKDLLNDQQKEVVERHTIIGADIIKRILNSSENIITQQEKKEGQLIQLVALSHHLVTSGYPVEITKETDRINSISMIISLFTLADQIAALKEDRPYRKEPIKNPEELFEKIKKNIESAKTRIEKTNVKEFIDTADKLRGIIGLFMENLKNSPDFFDKTNELKKNIFR